MNRIKQIRFIRFFVFFCRFLRFSFFKSGCFFAFVKKFSEINGFNRNSFKKNYYLCRIE